MFLVRLINDSNQILLPPIGMPREPMPGETVAGPNGDLVIADTPARFSEHTGEGDLMKGKWIITRVARLAQPTG